MVSHKLIVAVFFSTFSNVFLSAEGNIIGDIEDKNCLTVKSKYRPLQGQGTLWRHSFQKEFTDQEIETTKCKFKDQKCFGGMFSNGSGIETVCRTHTISMTIDIYRIDTGKITSQNIDNVEVGCGCHFVDNSTRF